MGIGVVKATRKVQGDPVFVLSNKTNCPGSFRTSHIILFDKFVCRLDMGVKIFRIYYVSATDLESSVIASHMKVVQEVRVL